MPNRASPPCSAIPGSRRPNTSGKPQKQRKPQRASIPGLCPPSRRSSRPNQVGAPPRGPSRRGYPRVPGHGPVDDLGHRGLDHDARRHLDDDLGPRLLRRDGQHAGRSAPLPSPRLGRGDEGSRPHESLRGPAAWATLALAGPGSLRVYRSPIMDAGLKAGRAAPLGVGPVAELVCQACGRVSHCSVPRFRPDTMPACPCGGRRQIVRLRHHVRTHPRTRERPLL